MLSVGHGYFRVSWKSITKGALSNDLLAYPTGYSRGPLIEVNPVRGIRDGRRSLGRTELYCETRSLEVIPDAAHLANVERPEAITQAILDHLSPVVKEGR